MSRLIDRFSPFKSPIPRSVNGDKESRGTKRKAKKDPYDEIDDDEPIRKTPSTQRTRSRISSEAPSSKAKGRPSSSGKAGKRRSGSLGVRKGEAVDASANLARAQEPEAARLQRQPEEENPKNSLVPVADMGVPESSNDDAANGPTNGDPKPADEITAKPNAKGKAKATKGEQVDQKQTEIDEREEHEVRALLQHRMAQDGSGRVELLVHWVGEAKEDATWEFEEEIQKGAEETLYSYWKAKGGRMNVLFLRSKNSPPEIYHVFNIITHVKKARGGFEFEVQWVGHPATRGETSMEGENKLRKIAPEALDKYWADVGGRDQYLAKRGRNRKKAKTE